LDEIGLAGLKIDGLIYTIVTLSQLAPVGLREMHFETTPCQVSCFIWIQQKSPHILMTFCSV